MTYGAQPVTAAATNKTGPILWILFDKPVAILPELFDIPVRTIKSATTDCIRPLTPPDSSRCIET